LTHRQFVLSTYPTLKQNNPDLPILIREAQGTPARAFARFGSLTTHSRCPLSSDVELQSEVLNEMSRSMDCPPRMSPQRFPSYWDEHFVYQSVVKIAFLLSKILLSSSLPYPRIVSSIDQGGTRLSSTGTNIRHRISTSTSLPSIPWCYVRCFAVLKSGCYTAILCSQLTLRRWRTLSTHLISKVCCLDNITEQANFNNSS